MRGERMCLYVYCVQSHLHGCVCAYVKAQGSEVDTWCRLSLPYFLRPGILLKLEFTDSLPMVSRDLISLSPQNWNCRQTWPCLAIYVGAGDPVQLFVLSRRDWKH